MIPSCLFHLLELRTGSALDAVHIWVAKRNVLSGEVLPLPVKFAFYAHSHIYHLTNTAPSVQRAHTETVGFIAFTKPA
jgi:hypothetical protein